ncbi:MAG: hypothetical protein LBV30_01255 [Propionibacteriaceae bacterium]|jgi:uncharacterized protein YukE|nr:hypothetical protein [Propionibacteriaceae bacterium]
MSFEGMTPTEIDSAVARLEGQITRLNTVRDRVNSLVREATYHWQGADLRRFDSSWQGQYRGQIQAVINHIVALSSQLRNQAAAQRATSGDAPGGGIGNGTGPWAASGGGFSAGGGGGGGGGAFADTGGQADDQSGNHEYEVDDARVKTDVGNTGEYLGGGYTHGPDKLDGKYHNWGSKNNEFTAGHPIRNDAWEVDGYEDGRWGGWHDRPQADQPQTDTHGYEPADSSGHKKRPVSVSGEIWEGPSDSVDWDIEGILDSRSGSTGEQHGEVLGGQASGQASGWYGAHGEYSTSAGFADGQLQAEASGMIGVGAHGEASGQIQWGEVIAKGSGEATAGAWVSGDASIGIGTDGLHAKVGGEAMAGVSASADVSVGTEEASVGVGGSVYAGVGVKANVDADFGWDNVSVDVDLGAAIGIGAGIKINIDFSPEKIVDQIAEWWPF